VGSVIGLSLAAIVLVVAALAFAWSIGAHYTGACMGMAYASGAIDRRRALVGMAILTVLGAAIASERVVGNIGLNLVDAPELSLVAAATVILCAFLLTTAYNFARIPTSTIQIFVFSLVGVAVGAGIPVHWDNIGGLLTIWVSAPIAALGLGALLTVLLSRGARATAFPSPTAAWGPRSATLLIVMALAASFAMGANDVANATAVFVSTGLTSVLLAGVIGGVALAVGVLTWGGRLLTTVARDIVRVDRPMAIAAQSAQAVVILVAVVFFGAFTSMNQALVGGMAGAGLARGERTIHWPTLRGILVGWAVGPASGFAAGWIAIRTVAAFGLHP
jgi:inorganic phosphate transporter, PiT family